MNHRIKKIEKKGRVDDWNANSISVNTFPKTRNINKETKCAVDKSLFKSVISYSETVATILEKGRK